MSVTMTSQIAIKAGALFVDFENVFYALLNEPERPPREDALAIALEAIQGVRKHFRDEGHALIVERSYADWDQIPENAQRQLQVIGVLPRYADSRRDKNTADMELSLDILEHMLTQPDSQHVILIGGDRDYLPILRRIKERHRHICVCSLRKCLSGDVREFVSNYSLAQTIELDIFVTASDTGRRHKSNPPAQVDRVAPLASMTPDPANAPYAEPGHALDPLTDAPGDQDWNELYLVTMLRFLDERSYSEIHLAPDFRWLNTERVFESISTSEQRRIFNELKEQGAFRVEERDGFPHPYNIVIMNWNHPMVRRLNATRDGK